MEDKRFNRYIAITIIVLVVLLKAGCESTDYSYRGDYPELFSVAINSILGTRGFIQTSRVFNPDIKVVDIDDYGRVLFLYHEGGGISTINLVISQKSDDEYVYFYPHHNFISIASMVSGRGFWYYLNNPPMPIEESFTREAIEELKRRNDWNQPLNLDNAIRTKIVNIKADSVGPISNRVFNQAYVLAFEGDARERPAPSFFIADKYGRSLYLAGGYAGSRTGSGVIHGFRFIVLLFQPDGSFDVERGVMELHDLQQYQNELKAFMELNGWNEPWSE